MRITLQRVEGIGIVLRRQYQVRLGCTVMKGLRAHQHVAITACPADMQSRSSVLPTAVVLLDLAASGFRKPDTNGINDINIIALIGHVDRVLVTGSRVPAEGITRLLHTRPVILIDGRHTRVGNKSEALRQTEIRRQTQVIGGGENLIAVRVEINRIPVHYHTSHQLLTNQLRPYLFALVRSSNVVKDNLIAPSCRRRIRQHYIMFICYHDCGDLEIRSIVCRYHTVKLIRSRLILDIRTGRIVASDLQRQRIRMILRIILLYISLGI